MSQPSTEITKRVTKTTAKAAIECEVNAGRMTREEAAVSISHFKSTVSDQEFHTALVEACKNRRKE